MSIARRRTAPPHAAAQPPGPRTRRSPSADKCAPACCSPKGSGPPREAHGPEGRLHPRQPPEGEPPAPAPPLPAPRGSQVGPLRLAPPAPPGRRLPSPRPSSRPRRAPSRPRRTPPPARSTSTPPAPSSSASRRALPPSRHTAAAAPATLPRTHQPHAHARRPGTRTRPPRTRRTRRRWRPWRSSSPGRRRSSWTPPQPSGWLTARTCSGPLPCRLGREQSAPACGAAAPLWVVTRGVAGRPCWLLRRGGAVVSRTTVTLTAHARVPTHPATRRRVGVRVPGARTRPREEGGRVEAHRQPRVRAPAYPHAPPTPRPTLAPSAVTKPTPSPHPRRLPRCYPTGFIGLTRPLVDAGLLAPGAALACHAVSGYSGGGKALIKARFLRQQPAAAAAECARAQAAALSGAPAREPAVFVPVRTGVRAGGARALGGVRF